jgi:flagella basal body P-ring formation protein FlgA
VLGKKIRRAVNAGEPILPNLLLTPPVIRRGQTVTLKAGASRMSVSMAATALSDGGLGEVIDVTNDSSGRVVQGIVRSARVVEILLD